MILHWSADVPNIRKNPIKLHYYQIQEIETKYVH